MKVVRAVSVTAISVALAAAPALAFAQGRGAAPAAATDQTVPKDLKKLLTPHVSEMRLVTQRYTADRTLLLGNYAGPTGGGGGGGRGAGGGAGGGRGGGRGGRGGGADSANAGSGRASGVAPVFADSTPAPPVIVSPARVARLKRFDMSWQSAVTAVNATKLTPAARAERDTLLTTIHKNLAQLDVESASYGEVLPLLPFMPLTVGMIETRMRVEDIDAEKTAGMVTQVTKDIAKIRAQLDSGVAGNGGFRAGAAQAMHAASAVDALRANMNNWFIFYNGYDPLFSWWVRMPYRHLDSAFTTYAQFLRDKAAPGGQASAARVMPGTIEPAAAPKYNEVPDLAELIALPQDEMTDIAGRFVRRGNGGRGGGRGGADAAGPTPQATGQQYYQDWLTALKTIDFDKLSRNAQVDYLYIKKLAEIQLERVDKPLPPNPPRKTDNSGIPGAARGREGLIRDLQDELIPYTPEQLIALAEREFAWCDKEMLKASREMGFGDDWKKALEKTKDMHGPPGTQPKMIRELLFEAIDYLRVNDLVTLPQVDVESQRMIMMTPERQLVNPFFTGGGQMSVSYPTDDMEYEARLQSMRGNNRPWSHATVFHETIPGHNLTGYFNPRYAGYRANLGAGGPFFGEGWAVYWETILYDKGFDATPEDRVGALFWRMHRCARIIFSLKFHMGQWSPQEAVDFLIDRVGHEPENARAEVLRSFQGGYGPLYQAAYLLGALQLRGLRAEVVDTKQITEKAFHDEILRQGSMPVALLKLTFTKQKLTRDMPIDWKFYGELPNQ